jgi:hypothetical protein
MCTLCNFVNCFAKELGVVCEFGIDVVHVHYLTSTLCTTHCFL